MTDTATPDTGPVDAPASIESIVAELETGGEQPADNLEEVTQQLVNETEGTDGDSVTEPGPEGDATDTAEEAAENLEEGPPEGTEEADAFAKLIATNPDLKVKIKVNGETIEVPLSELPNGYSRNEDYKAKTAAVAEERRAVEAEKASLDTTLKAQYANQLEEATNLFAQFDPVLAEAARIDWDALKRADPAAYVAAQDAVQERLNAKQQMMQHVERLRGETQERQQQQMQEERAQRFDTAANEIVKLRPELADEAKFKAFAGDTVEFLKGVGFTGEEIVDALDHRVLTLADKARRWDPAKAKGTGSPIKSFPRSKDNGCPDEHLSDVFRSRQSRRSARQDHQHQPDRRAVHVNGRHFDRRWRLPRMADGHTRHRRAERAASGRRRYLRSGHSHVAGR
jgi:hypothetical protein